MARVAGVGTLTATLSGKILTITGTFEGLRSPCNHRSQIHRAPKGIPGPAILDLSVTNAEKGAVSGSVELTPDQIADLRGGRLVRANSIRARPGGKFVGMDVVAPVRRGGRQVFDSGMLN